MGIIKAKNLKYDYLKYDDNKCKKCGGSGLETETVLETVNIPRGLSNGW